MTDEQRQQLLADLDTLVGRLPEGPSKYVLSLLRLCLKTGLEEDLARQMIPVGESMVQAAEQALEGLGGDGHSEGNPPDAA